VPKPSFVNNTLVDNSARDGSAFYIMNHKPLLMNNILWDSLAEDAVWGEIFLGDDPTWKSWVEGNTYGDAEVHYTDIQKGWNKGTGNFDADPKLSETTCSLSISSPCIGKGIDSVEVGGVWYQAPASDFFGRERPRPAGTRPDIGACEELTVDIPMVYGSIPADFALEQNYPNPFNPSTTIRYGLPQRSRVTLTIFNTLGQQVATLVRAEQEPGHHEVQFYASGLASGVYLYRLQAGDFVQSRKLLLLR
jgi:hypothetical protein